jgi:hypothetical protein
LTDEEPFSGDNDSEIVLESDIEEDCEEEPSEGASYLAEDEKKEVRISKRNSST